MLTWLQGTCGKVWAHPSMHSIGVRRSCLGTRCFDCISLNDEYFQLAQYHFPPFAVSFFLHLERVLRWTEEDMEFSLYIEMKHLVNESTKELGS